MSEYYFIRRVLHKGLIYEPGAIVPLADGDNIPPYTERKGKPSVDVQTEADNASGAALVPKAATTAGASVKPRPGKDKTQNKQ